MQKQTLLRGLGLGDSMSLVVGSIIGTGVFLKAAPMLQGLGSPRLVLLVWLVAGVVSLFGALTYAELGALFPLAGGEYVYLRRAYGNLPAFLYGWTRFWIASPSSIAAYAVGAAAFMPLETWIPWMTPANARSIIAVSLVLIFCGINCLTVAFSGHVQSLLTLIKTTSIVGLAFGLLLASPVGTWDHFSYGGPLATAWPGWTAWNAAMMAALWAYDGWNNLPMAAGEVKNPQRNIPISLVLGMCIVLLIYGLINTAYYYGLPPAEILTSYSNTHATSMPVATKAALALLGSFGAQLLSFVFIISILGSMHGSILTGARVPYAMASDHLFFRQLAILSTHSHVPVWSVLSQGALSCLLAASGSFDQLTDYVVFTSWIFYAANTAGVMVLRKRMPELERSYRVFGYPWVPLIFLGASLALLVNTIYSRLNETLIGLILIGIGIPVYYWFRKRNRQLMEESAVAAPKVDF